MEKADQDEKQIAIDSGNLDADGVPYRTVVADGQRTKRSY